MLAPPSTLLWDGAALLRSRAAVAAGDPTLHAAVDQLRADAAMAYSLPLQSVTNKPHPPPGGDLHDYTSYSSYFWPCTAKCNTSLFANCTLWGPPPKTCNETTGLPWVGRDGYNDPNSALDRPAWSAMLGAVNALAASTFFLNESAHAARAAALLRTWFLDNATAMRPAATFAQAIPGRKTTPNLIDFSDGADPGGGGNYDTTISLAHALDSARLLEWVAPDAWTAADRAALTAWVREWLRWVASSSASTSEHAATNNIALFYDTMLAAASHFVGNASAVDAVCRAAPAARVAVQVSPDGDLPAENRRTKSESYHAFALTALLDLAWICRAAAPAAPDLWASETSDGRSVRGAVEWAAPFADGRLPWTAGEQIRPFDATAYGRIYRAAAIGFAGDSERRFAAIAAKQPGAAASREWLLRPYPSQ